MIVRHAIARLTCNCKFKLHQTNAVLVLLRFRRFSPFYTHKYFVSTLKTQITDNSKIIRFDFQQSDNNVIQNLSGNKN